MSWPNGHLAVAAQPSICYETSAIALRKISTIFHCVPCNPFLNMWPLRPLSKCTDRYSTDHGDYEPHLAASFKDCINLKNFIKIFTTRCGGDEWSGSNRFGRCGGLLRPDVVWFGLWRDDPALNGEDCQENNMV
jgi:hypothetical protein